MSIPHSKKKHIPYKGVKLLCCDRNSTFRKIRKNFFRDFITLLMFCTLQAVNKLINKLKVSGGLFYQEKKFGLTGSKILATRVLESKWTTFMVLFFSSFLVFHGHYEPEDSSKSQLFSSTEKTTTAYWFGRIIHFWWTIQYHTESLWEM